MKHVNPPLVNAPQKCGWKIQWIRYFWEWRINNEEVCENYENKETDNERDISKYESENANTVKNELKLNIDEQQDAIKHLKEYGDIDDIEPPWKD